MQRQQNLKTFFIIWFGQFVSLIGTAMTRFAVLIWAYQQTGAATALAMLGFFAFIPYALVSPFAGIVVDRFDRRKVMLASDGMVGVVTMLLLLLYSSGRLEIWHLFVSQFLIGTFESFQRPAYYAATSVLVPKESLGRINGLQSLARNASRVAAPFLGAALLPVINLNGIMWIDVATFGVAMVTLMLVRIPMPAEDESAETNPTSWKALSVGFLYSWQRPGLRGMMISMALVSFLAATTYFGIMPAMVLARSGGDDLALALVQSVMGIGGVIGSLLMTAWGGTKRKIDTLYIAMIISFLLGDSLLGIGRTPFVWALGAFLAQLFIPLINSAEMTIWQAKIPLALQGRVLAAHEAFITGWFALGFLVAGPLADRVFEPALADGGMLAPTLGWLVGTGSGAGMGLMFVCTSLLGVAISVISYLIPAIRHVEDNLPDHDSVPTTVTPTTTISLTPLEVETTS